MLAWVYWMLTQGASFSFNFMNIFFEANENTMPDFRPHCWMLTFSCRKVTPCRCGCGSYTWQEKGVCVYVYTGLLCIFAWKMHICYTSPNISEHLCFCVAFFIIMEQKQQWALYTFMYCSMFFWVDLCWYVQHLFNISFSILAPRSVP